MTFSSDSTTPRPAKVLGIPVHLLDNYTEWLQTRWQQGKGTHVVTLNAEMVMLARKDSDLASAIAKADLVIPDGAGVILSLRLQGEQQQRCPGIELAGNLLSGLGEEITQGKSFFYGGVPRRAEAAAKYWREQFPNLAIETEHGYLSASEQMELCQRLSQQQPQLILVALGVPRQETWIAKNRHLCPQAIWMGVGGAFDIWGGAKTRAPAWFREHHLEWLYRLYQEPSRWRRMLVLPSFAFATLVRGNRG
jgi:N-acetylglucosaminyldiphosphoundecaprenol N-acetyl-beta-D-mannosaminyltransferase